MLWEALVNTLRSRRFWVWQIVGAFIYGIPVFIRLVTGEVVLPVLGWFETPWIDHFVPGNLVEKILVNAFFPGGAGAVAGEIFYLNLKGESKSRKQLYLSRLGGAMIWTGAWSLFQLWGNLQNITGSYGGNLFEYPMVFPLNFLIAAFSVFTPTIVSSIKVNLAASFRRYGSNQNKSAS